MSGGFSVTFWGVRGSIACPGREYERYGGNTSCLEVRCAGHVLVFDAGTGLRPLGEKLKAEKMASQARLEIDLFLTHTHLDHIVGIPFFKPLYDKANSIRFWAGHLLPDQRLKDAICAMMVPPLFPVPIDIFPSRTIFNDFGAGETLRLHPEVALVTRSLNHPNGATGYRIEHGGKSICYVTDTEHVAGRLDANVLALAEGADILIYDSTYTEEEYPRYAGWGHSTWAEGLKIAEAAGVKTFVAFHHDPSHDDAFMDRVAQELAAARPGSLVAREGLTLEP
jgi:phosphoribosyl 1,2-cyclic phosphodiesterase